MNKLRNKIRSLSEGFGNREISRDALKMFVIQMITMGISFFPSILISRSIGPEMKGRYDLFNLLNGYILEFGTLGFGSGILYYQLSKKYTLARVHGTVIAFCAVMGGLLTAAGLCTLRLWEGMFAGLPYRYMVLALVICPFSFYKLIFNNMLLGMDKAVVSYYLSLALGIFDLLFVLFLFLTGGLTYSAIILLVSGETIILSFVGVIYMLRSGRGLGFDPSLLWNALKYGIVLYAGAMANSILFKIDLLFINYFKGNEAVGVYSVAVRWAEMLFLLDSAISSATLYKISTGDEKEAKAIVAKTMRLQLTISGAVGTVMVFAAYPLIRTLYGEAYIGAVLPLIILLPGIIIWSVGKILSQYIVYKMGKAKYCTYTAILGAVLNAGLNCVVIPAWGIAGAAVSSTVCYGTVIGGTFLIYKIKQDKE